LVGNRFEVGIGFLAEDLRLGRVDRDDAIALLLQVGDDVITLLLVAGGKPHAGDRARG
jgi:hypothetical protein